MASVRLRYTALIQEAARTGELETFLSKIQGLSEELAGHLNCLAKNSPAPPAMLDGCLRINRSLHQLAQDFSRHIEVFRDEKVSREAGRAFRKVIVNLSCAVHLFVQHLQLENIQEHPCLNNSQRLEYLFAMSENSSMAFGRYQ
jgi:hypothetical protein